MNPSYESYGTGDAWADWESPYQLDWVDWSTIQSAPGLDPTNSIFPHGSATFEGIDSAWTDSGSGPTFQPALITDNSSQGLRALHYGQQADAEAIPTPMPVCFSLDVTQDTWLTTPCCWSGAGASANVDSTYITDGVELAPQPDHYEPASLTTLPPTSDVGAPSDFFQQLPTSRLDPPLDDSQPNASLRKQKPRSEGDLYAAQWIRGERSDRAGWCGYCCLWFKLKDSAYWVRVEPMLDMAAAVLTSVLVSHALYARHQLRERPAIPAARIDAQDKHCQ